MPRLYYRAAPSATFTSGYDPLITRSARQAEFLDFGLLRLQEGERHRANTGEDEVALVVLSGSCELLTADHQWSRVGSRPNVFAGKPYACYVPTRSDFEVVGRPGGVEIAVCAAAAAGDAPRRSRMVIPEEIEVEVRGAGAWTHTVRDVIGMNVDAGRLLVGETVSPPGMWASYPPHKHAKEDGAEEARLEEVRHFRIEPDAGFGIQLAYDRAADAAPSAAAGDGRPDDPETEVRVVRHTDTVRISGGYHATAAAPGYKMYALWVAAGNARRYAVRTDPDHAWLRDAEPMLALAERRP